MRRTHLTIASVRNVFDVRIALYKAPIIDNAAEHLRNITALDISTGPLARHTFQTAGPVRASTFYLSLARTGHLDISRASRFQIVLARTMTIHSMYFSRGRPFATARRQRVASPSRACQSNTLTSVFRSRGTSTRTSGTHPGIFLREAHVMVPSKQFCVLVG